MTRIHRLLVVSVAFAAVPVAGCGSSGSAPASSSAASSSQPTASVGQAKMTVTLDPKSSAWRSQLNAEDCRFKPQLAALISRFGKIGANTPVTQISAEADQIRSLIIRAVSKFKDVQVPASERAPVGRWLGDLDGEEAALQSLVSDIKLSDRSAAAADGGEISRFANLTGRDQQRMGVGCPS